MADVVGSGYFGQRLPVAFPVQSFVPLVLSQLGLSAELDPPAFCPLPTFVSAGHDQVTLKLS